MKSTFNLRQHFIPVQPAVKGVENNVSYREILPDTELQPFVYCYWELKSSQSLTTSFNYRVVPDGCIDIFFRLCEPDQSFVMGFSNQYTEYSLGHSFHYIGIRFLPTVFPRLFGIRADELSNRFETLENVVPDISSFIERHLTPDMCLLEIKNMLDSNFLHRLSHIAVDDRRVTEAIRIILANTGSVSITNDLKTGLSQRQMRRLFRFYVGSTPKMFSKVVRFQYILRETPSFQQSRKNKLFYDAGYYDQAHFINEFKTLFGLPPGRAFKRN